MDVNFGGQNTNSAENWYEIWRGNLCEHRRENLGEIRAKIRVKIGAKIGAKIDAKFCVCPPLISLSNRFLNPDGNSAPFSAPFFCANFGRFGGCRPPFFPRKCVGGGPGGEPPSKIFRPKFR